MSAPSSPYVVDFPTLWVVPAWVKRHCIVPDRDAKGKPFRMYDWQLWCTLNHYRVKTDAKVGQLGPAFFYRRSLIVAPQKTGKGPWSACTICGEAVGPVLFAGWAGQRDEYHCSEYGCDCGWTYRYREGEAMGRPWATPLIQLLATSSDQVKNVWRPLQSMIRSGPLSSVINMGELFARLPNDGLIEKVTSSALSRLGNPISFAGQDETQLYTDTNGLRDVATTQRRGAAGMGGRSMETTNPWDSAEKSVAQQTWESKRPDIFKFWRQPPTVQSPDGTLRELVYKDKRDRRKIHEYVYAGSLIEDGGHVDLDGIEAEAAELMETDPGQAERFYGNRVVAGLGSWSTREAWKAREKPQTVKTKTQIVLGFDGSDVDDWTGIRAETRDGYQFTPETPAGSTIWDPSDYDGQVPRLDVNAAVEWLFANYDVIRMYCDPPYWETETDAWAEKYGKERVIRWYTKRTTQMHEASERLLTDIAKVDSGFSHDACQYTEDHIASARKKAASITSKNPQYTLAKPGDGRKIDLAVCSVICHEAFGDVTAEKLWKKQYRAYSA